MVTLMKKFRRVVIIFSKHKSLLKLFVFFSRSPCPVSEAVLEGLESALETSSLGDSVTESSSAILRALI